jgi:hypothetical protein
MGTLAASLRKLDHVLPALAAESFAPPASAKQRDALARDVLGGKLPAELAEWFGWRNGQREITPLDPKNNFTAISAQEARKIWRLLNDRKADCLRPKPTWLPLFENGGGDYLMYETSGPKRGALFVYLHDDADWPRAPEYKSLSDWAIRVTAGQAKLAKAKPRKAAFDLGSLKFATIGRAPPLAKLEPGTVLRITYARDWFVVFLKTGPNAWMWNGATTADRAVREVDAELRKKRSDFTADDAYVRTQIAELEPAKRKLLARATAR